MDAAFARAYRDAEPTHWWFRARRDLLVRLLESRVPAGGTVLDVGCGTGFFLDALRERYVCRGLEFDPDAVARCRARGLTGVVQADAETLSRMAGEDVDAVTFLDVLEHLDDDLAVLRHALAVLRPGGTLLATVPAYAWLWSRHDELNHHRRRYTTDRLGRVAREAGFTVDACAYFNGLLFPLAVAQRIAWQVRRPTPEEMMAVPSPRLNRVLERMFRAEEPFLTGPIPRGLPAGLSVFLVARRPG